MSPLLDYTTKVAPARTVDVITRALVKAGARQIMTEYDADGEPSGLAFAIETAVGPRQFAIPVDPVPVEKVLYNQGVQGRYQGPEQARRVAWRILKDWVEAQVAIVETEMVTLDQVMLPYMRTGSGQTIYQQYLDSAGFRGALEEGSD